MSIFDPRYERVRTCGLALGSLGAIRAAHPTVLATIGVVRTGIVGRTREGVVRAPVGDGRRSRPDALGQPRPLRAFVEKAGLPRLAAARVGELAPPLAHLDVRQGDG